MASRAAFYFKLHRQVGMRRTIGMDEKSMFVISGEVMKRRACWLPAFLDEGVGYITESYSDPNKYNDMLLSLENRAFKDCAKLCAQNQQIEPMIAVHKSNLK